MIDTPDLFGPKVASQPKPVELRIVRIEFDGGNGCNIPRMGYGTGYGSYRIDNGPVSHVNHGRPMSNNVAEIATLIAALRQVAIDGSPESTRLEIVGDSQIALSRCRIKTQKNGAPRQNQFSRKKPPSADFKSACKTLLNEISRFGAIETKWQPRHLSVATFGH